MPAQTDVLIVGAGPTGLVLALWLTRLGVRVRIIDKTDGPGTTSRAVAVQARTLELYRQIDLAGAVVARGRRAVAANVWVAGRHTGTMRFGDMGRDISPYPYALIYPQDEHEQLLIDRLASAGIRVERTTTLLSFEAGERVRARLQCADGTIETCEAAYLAGCDGAHSAVREQSGIGFPGGTYAHLFYVADVTASGPPINGEVHVAFENTDFLALFPLKEAGHARLIGTIRQTSGRAERELSWPDVSRHVIGQLRITVERVNWFSTYRVHHRVADAFRRGRVFLLGDAAHIHSPVGGQGMNTGIGDAINLAWKIAAVLQGRAAIAMLDTYEPERIAFARRLVETTDRAFTAVTSSTTVARVIRLHLVPLLMPALLSVRAVRRLMFRIVSQTSVHYRGCALSEGRAGPVRGGDRLPWVMAPDAGGGDGTGAGDGDNFTPLSSLDWQVHVYGDAAASVGAACKRRGVPLHVFRWEPAMRRRGIRQGAAYLVRPDGYVGGAFTGDSGAALERYLDAWAIRPSTSPIDSSTSSSATHRE